MAKLIRGSDVLPTKVFKLTEPIIIAGLWTLISISLI